MKKHFIRIFVLLGFIGCSGEPSKKEAKKLSPNVSLTNPDESEDSKNPVNEQGEFSQDPENSPVDSSGEEEVLKKDSRVFTRLLDDDFDLFSYIDRQVFDIEVCNEQDCQTNELFLQADAADLNELTTVEAIQSTTATVDLLNSIFYGSRTQVPTFFLSDLCRSRAPLATPGSDLNGARLREFRSRGVSETFVEQSKDVVRPLKLVAKDETSSLLEGTEIVLNYERLQYSAVYERPWQDFGVAVLDTVVTLPQLETEEQISGQSSVPTVVSVSSFSNPSSSIGAVGDCFQIPSCAPAIYAMKKLGIDIGVKSLWQIYNLESERMQVALEQRVSYLTSEDRLQTFGIQEINELAEGVAEGLPHLETIFSESQDDWSLALEGLRQDEIISVPGFDNLEQAKVTLAEIQNWLSQAKELVEPDIQQLGCIYHLRGIFRQSGAEAFSHLKVTSSIESESSFILLKDLSLESE